jgi:hypothetical protein
MNLWEGDVDCNQEKCAEKSVMAHLIHLWRLKTENCRYQISTSILIFYFLETLEKNKVVQMWLMERMHFGNKDKVGR